MVNVTPGPVVVEGSNVGGQALAILVQALSWLAFGFFFCGGWRLMELALSKA